MGSTLSNIQQICSRRLKILFKLLKKVENHVAKGEIARFLESSAEEKSFYKWKMYKHIFKYNAPSRNHSACNEYNYRSIGRDFEPDLEFLDPHSLI